jgi:hypothetical protein
MPSPRILFVKLSSLGDVVHHLPAVTEVRDRWPAAHVAWAVEPAYANLVRLHPAVDEAIPVNLRSLKRGWYRPSEWGLLRESRRLLRDGRWDYVVDTQGLIKSALIARSAGGARFGFDAASARERLATRFYDVRLPVARRLHAVERNRRLAASVFGYRLAGAPDYGLRAPDAAPAWAPAGPYIVMLHAASHKQKLWPEAYWVELGQKLAGRRLRERAPRGHPAGARDRAPHRDGHSRKPRGAARDAHRARRPPRACMGGGGRRHRAHAPRGRARAPDRRPLLRDGSAADRPPRRRPGGEPGRSGAPPSAAQAASALGLGDAAVE